MAYHRLKQTVTGKQYYEIIVSRGRGQSQLSMRWYIPDGWGQKAIDRELKKVEIDFERKAQGGEIISKAEQKELDLRKAQEAAKIQTLRQYSENVFMPSLSVRCSENTRSTYQGNLDHWILPALGDFKLSEITPASITALLLKMQAQGKSQSTCVKVYTILHSLFRSAYMSDTIERNPMDKVERPKPRKDEVQSNSIESYTVEQLQQILKGLDQEPLKWQAFMHLLIDSGIRRGEACALRWQDVDFKSGTVTISGNLCYTPQKGVYMDTPKNKQVRTIDVDSSVIKLLRGLRAEQAEKSISQFVFTQENSPDPMHPQSPTRYMKKFSRKYCIDDLHPHKLRHTFASIAITNGADIASVSEKLGHSDKAVTLRMYTHADKESIKRAGDIFREAIKQG